MSMKRTKQSSKGRGPSSRELERSPLFASKKDDGVKYTWKQHVADADDAAFKAYDMSHKYARGDLLSHAKFGKGVVTVVDEKRIDVLFEDATKKLGHDTQVS